METFSALLAICAGNSPVPGELPTHRPVARSVDVFFDLRPNKQLNEAGDLGRNRAHYDVTVMVISVDGILLDSTKPLPETISTEIIQNHLPADFTWNA